MPPAIAGARPVLMRTLRPRGVAVLTLSALSPAASVFVTGSSVLHLAGTGAAAAIVAGGLIANLAALIYAELGAAFPRAGGPYPGVTAVLGASCGSVVLVLTVITAPAFLAFAALGLADYVRVLAPTLPKLSLAFVAIGTATLLSVLQIRTNAWLTGAVLAAELIGLGVVCFVVAFHPARSLSTALLHPQLLVGGRLVATPPATMLLATVAGAYACAGSGLAIYFAEDMQGPPQRIGRVVILTSLVATAAVAVPLVLLAMGIGDLRTTLAADAPIPAYLLGAVGAPLTTAVTLAVALAILNNIVASMLASARFLFSTGRDGVWPERWSRALARLHPRFGSPWVAAVALGLAGAALCLVGQRRLLAILSGEVLSVALIIAAVVVGRRRGLTGATSFRAPLFPLTPIVALLLVAAFVAANWMDRDAGRPGLLALSAVAAIAFAWQRTRRRTRRDQ